MNCTDIRVSSLSVKFPQISPAL